MPQKAPTINSSAAGDAAASLAALFAESAPFSAGKAAAASDSGTSGDGSSSEHVVGSADERTADSSNAAQNAWRVKFLQKVGAVPNQQKANEEGPPDGSQDIAEPLVAESPGSTGVDVSTEEVDDIFEEVQQPAPRRSDADIRGSYIKKLEQSRAFIPQLNRPKRSQTVTIFDWDDTLLCTSTPPLAACTRTRDTARALALPVVVSTGSCACLHTSVHV